MSKYLETKIIESAIDELLAHDFALSVNDGEETTVKASRDRAVILAAMRTTDEDFLIPHAKLPSGNYDPSSTGQFGWVRFIYGNDGWDVINDYSTRLEAYLLKTNALAEEMSA